MTGNVAGIGLLNHGVPDEMAQVRCHVVPGIKRLFFFTRENALRAIEMAKKSDAKLRMASQPGVKYATGAGYTIPYCDKTLAAVSVLVPPDIWGDGISESDSTSMKGQKAMRVVKAAIEKGLVPIDKLTAGKGINEVSDRKAQIEGADLIAWWNIRIQVKCDIPAQVTHKLFLQTAERNPFKAY